MKGSFALNTKKNTVFISPIAVITGAVYVLLLAWLHYRQADLSVSSDLPAYLTEIRGEESGYSFPYPLFFFLSGLLYHVLPIEWAVTVVLSVFNAIAFFGLYKWVKKTFDIPDWAAVLITVITFIVSMIFFPLDIHSESEWWNFRYLGVFSPNPYQNATYFATRPFAILLFTRFYDVEGGQRKIRDYVLLGTWLLLSVLAKPSFVLIFLPVMGFVTLFDCLFKPLKDKHLVKMLIAVIPACVALIIQYLSVFEASTEADGGIHIGVAVVWHLWTKGIKEAFILANLFPLLFMIFHIDLIKKERLLRYAWYTHLVGLSTFVLLYEGGVRMRDANFAWGYMHGMFFVFFVSICLTVKRMFSGDVKGKWREIVTAPALILHVICGMLFLVYVLEGGSVYTF